VDNAIFNSFFETVSILYTGSRYFLLLTKSWLRLGASWTAGGGGWRRFQELWKYNDPKCVRKPT